MLNYSVAELRLIKMETIRNKKHVNASKSLQNEGGFLISFHPDEVSRKYFFLLIEHK